MSRNPFLKDEENDHLYPEWRDESERKTLERDESEWDESGEFCIGISRREKSWRVMSRCAAYAAG